MQANSLADAKQSLGLTAAAAHRLAAKHTLLTTSCLSDTTLVEIAPKEALVQCQQ